MDPQKMFAEYHAKLQKLNQAPERVDIESIRLPILDMEKPEKLAKEAVWDEGRAITYKVELGYDSAGDYPDIPRDVNITISDFDKKVKLKKGQKAINESYHFKQSPPSAGPEGPKVLSFNKSSAAELKKAAKDNNIDGLQGIFFDKLVEKRPYSADNEIGMEEAVRLGYTDKNAFETALKEFRKLKRKIVITYD